MSWTAADIPKQEGRVAVVTGANGGLGLANARALAAAGAHVVMAVRDREKAADIRTGTPAASLELVGLDLSSQQIAGLGPAQPRGDTDAHIQREEDR